VTHEPRVFARASVVMLMAALAGGGCARSTVHRALASTWFVPVPTVQSCDAANELLATESPWRVNDVDTHYGIAYVDLRPIDELWMVEVKPWGDDGAFGELEGFEATVRCGNRTYELELLECSMDEGRRLFIPANQLPQEGTPARPCRLELELRHGEQRWFAKERWLVLRRGLGRWRTGSTPVRPPPRTPSPPSPAP